jgi:hypothetical protein
MALFSGAGNGKMLHFYTHRPVSGLSYLGLIAALLDIFGCIARKPDNLEY